MSIKKSTVENIESFILDLVGASFLVAYLFLTPIITGTVMIALDLPQSLTLFLLLEGLFILAPLFLWFWQRRR